MQTLTARNPAEGLRVAISRLTDQGKIIDTRNGPAYTLEEPLLVNLTHPKECFVADPVRDANPFFALAEAFWLLAGRDDTRFLDQYVKTFGERYSDNGILLGSYGKRWRSHFGFDQIPALIQRLRADPNTRQAVLQMWEPNDLTVQAKDRPCNTAIMFRIRNSALDMLIINRSNDIWNGMFGYNPVQFSILQRVIADHVGIPIGKYWVCSNDAHFYVSDAQELMKRGKLSKILYPDQTYKRIVSNLLTWEPELQDLMVKLDQLHDLGVTDIPVYKNGFLSEVFKACLAYYYYRQKNYVEAWNAADLIGDKAWRTFCTDWLTRKTKRD